MARRSYTVEVVGLIRSLDLFNAQVIVFFEEEAYASFIAKDSTDGDVTSKPVGGVTTTYTWDQTGLGTVVGDGASEYAWGDGLVSQITVGGVATYAHADGLGSIRLLTDGAGAVVGTQQYDAFGPTRAQAGAQLPFTFTGEQLDPESGLVYLRARYLDPATGRFLTKDPFAGFLSDPGSLQQYAYARNNPGFLVDPSGLYPGEHAINKVKDAAGSVVDAAEQAAQDGLHIGLDLAAVPPYIDYYVSYNALREFNDFGDQFGPAGTAVSRVAGCPLVAAEAGGLAGDVAVDWVKGHTVNHESIRDEGIDGYINPLHDYVPHSLVGPTTYLPGIHADGDVDWEW